MDRHITPLEAWQDFYDWFRAQPGYSDITQKERKRIYEANAAAKGQRTHPLGYSRIKDILTTYAPDRYEFREAVILKDDA